MPTPAKVPGADEVPVVSTRLYDDDFDGFVRALGEAYERYGFVILEEHGIEQELITTAMERSKAFFACDDACKRKYVLQCRSARGVRDCQQPEDAVGVLRSLLRICL